MFEKRGIKEIVSYFSTFEMGRGGCGGGVGGESRGVIFIVWSVVFRKTILNKRINPIKEYLENTFIVVTYKRDKFSSSAFSHVSLCFSV